ncbi:gamma-aminobutyric acid type B receptor subunit 1-like [Ptychodera flava]|uniref:gamma-aminobutyric acid type B receptor subunit 1-like n=1 Tax=Ptychodera flava TaxID=63121 RepID=UPI00396A8655
MRGNLYILLQVIVLASGKTTIHLGGLFVMSGEHLFWAGSVYPGALLALEDINNRDDILPDYYLEMVANDTKGDAGRAIHSLIEMALTPPTKIMLIGGAQGEESIALAETSKWWNMIQVIPATATPVLSNRQRFPLSFRTRMSLLMFTEVRLAILRHFEWQRVGIIYTNDQSILTTVRTLTQALLEANVTLVASEQFSSTVAPSYQMAKLKESGARIIIALAFTYIDVRLLFCEAYKLDMIGPKYVYIAQGHSDYLYWMEEDPRVTCSAEEVTTALQGLLMIGDMMYRPDGKATISGMVSEVVCPTCTREVTSHNTFARRAMPSAYPSIYSSRVAHGKPSSTLLLL